MDNEVNIESKKRLVFFLPNVFTAFNMACGFGAIILSIQGDFYKACMILILGAIFDSVDGRVARLTGTQSSFGEQFDSISDVISFGMAPSIIMYNRFFGELGRIGIVISFLFLLCGALRLARFNASLDKVDSSFFQGLPIPVGALALVSYVFLSLEVRFLNIHPFVTMAYVVLYSLLMISTIPFYSFKHFDWGKNKKIVLIVIFLFFALTFMYEQFVIGIAISIYVLVSIISFLIKKRGALGYAFMWKNEKDSNEP